MTTLKRLYKKFVYPCRGFVYLIRRELSFQIEVAVFVLVVLAAWVLGFSPHDWTVLLVVSAMVLASEVVNTVLERVLDLIEPRLSIHVALLKDLLSLAVLIASGVAFVVGFILFWQYV